MEIKVKCQELACHGYFEDTITDLATMRRYLQGGDFCYCPKCSSPNVAIDDSGVLLFVLERLEKIEKRIKAIDDAADFAAKLFMGAQAK